MALTKVYLIRHAQADGNLNRRFHGITNSEITETGKKQLQYLKKRCAEYRFDVAYSSPLKRALETARAAIGDRDIRLNIEPRFSEMNIGCMEDVPYAELTVRFPEDFRIWTNEPHKFAPRDGETMEQVRDRMYAAFCDVVRENEGKNVLIASHGCAMRALLCRLKNVDFDKLSTLGWTDNTAVYIMEVDEKFNVKFLAENDVSHLPDELSTLKKQSWWKSCVAIPAHALGIDYGDSRTGLALSDENKTLASPAGTIRETNPEKILEKAAKFAVDNNCSEIVIGFPLNMNGTRGPRAEKSADFAHKLEMKTGISAHLWDERLTTVGATAYMNASNFRGQKRKDNIDTASACLILQGYLDYIKKR